MSLDTPDLTEPVAAAAQAHYERVASEMPGRNWPDWDDLTPFDRNQIASTVLPIVTAAAPLIYKQGRSDEAIDRLRKELHG